MEDILALLLGDTFFEGASFEVLAVPFGDLDLSSTFFLCVLGEVDLERDGSNLEPGRDCSDLELGRDPDVLDIATIDLGGTCTVYIQSTVWCSIVH